MNSNQPTRCNKFSSFITWRFMYSSTCFGHPHTHHQELNNCSSSLWFYRWSVVVVVLLVVAGPAGPPTTNSTATTALQRYNQRLLLQLLSSWWWAWGRPKHVELYIKRQVIKLEKLLHLVGWFIWIVWGCTDLQALNLKWSEPPGSVDGRYFLTGWRTVNSLRPFLYGL